MFAEGMFDAENDFASLRVNDCFRIPVVIVVNNPLQLCPLSPVSPVIIGDNLLAPDLLAASSRRVLKFATSIVL
jgi:hypothetical protein